MPPAYEGGVFISTEKIYEQFVRMNEQLAQLNRELSQLTTLMTDTREAQADMENRLRSVEKWKYGIPIAYFSAILSVLTTFFKFSGKQP